MANEERSRSDKPRVYWEGVVENLELLRKIGVLHPRIAYVAVAREIEIMCQEINPGGVEVEAADIDSQGRLRAHGRTQPERRALARTQAARWMVREFRKAQFLSYGTRCVLGELSRREGECAHRRVKITYDEVSAAIDSAIELVRALTNEDVCTPSFHCSQGHLVAHHVRTIMEAAPGEVVEEKCDECGEVFSRCSVPDPTEGQR